jgi:uncharacterized protein (DUF58 family)
VKENSDSVGSTDTATFTRVKDGGLGAPARALGLVIQISQVVWRMILRGTAFARETVTVIGWLCLALAVVALPIGLSLRWVEFTVAGAMAVMLLVVAVPFLFGGRAYSVGFKLSADRVVAGSEAQASVSVTNISPRLQLPGRIDIPVGPGLVDLGLPLMRPGQVFNEDVMIPAQRRGVLDIGPVTTVRTDPVGLLSHELHWAEIRRLFIHPMTVSVPSTSTGFIRDLEGNPTQIITDSDISFHAIQEYQAGDSYRHIHWKSTAKTGKLMVRRFEETRRSRMVLALGINPDEYASPDEFELAVSSLGSLGVRAIRDGRDVSVLTSAMIPVGGKRSVKSIRTLNSQSPSRLLDDLSLIESSSQTMNLEGVCSLTSQVVRDMSVVVLFCGSNVTPQSLQRMRLQLPSDIGVVAVVSDLHHEPSFRALAGIGVMTVAILDDLRSLLSRYSG